MDNNEQMNRRFIAQLQRLLVETNRKTIDPLVPELTLEAFEDVIEMAARVRGAYLRQYFDLANKADTGLPSPEDVVKLRGTREVYDEMTAAHQALETAIERGYLSVKAK